MAAKTSKDPMGWLKLNVGLFSSQTQGLSDTHIAIYIKLLIIYWTAGNKLPEAGVILNRRLGITDQAGEQALSELIAEFFPLDPEGNPAHPELDRQLSEIIDFSKKQSEKASRPRGGYIKPNPSYIEDDDGKF